MQIYTVDFTVGSNADKFAVPYYCMLFLIGVFNGFHPQTIPKKNEVIYVCAKTS
jgi:hypothetical protein